MIWAGCAPTSSAVAAVATAGTPPCPLPRPVPDSAASGNWAPGAWSVTAAYCAGLTNTAVSSPPLAVSVAPYTTPVAVAETPGSAAIWRCSPGGNVCPLGASMTASAPTCRQDSATWPRVTDVLIMAANATMLSTSTRANAGRPAPGGVRVARARPTNAATPRDRPAIRASARATGG